MRCPVCDTVNAEDAGECAVCGKVFLLEGYVDADDGPLPELEPTLLDPLESAAGPIELLPGVEPTLLADARLEVAVEALEVERTPIEARLDDPGFWQPGLDELDQGREQPDGVRTAAPVDAGTCPYCGAVGQGGAVCDQCGRRRNRFSEPAPALRPTSGSLELRLCPACFGRVPDGPRCSDCGVPLPLREL